MKKKLYINTIVSLIFQVSSVVIGLILPRLILQTFGSDVNGLVQSITQMLSVISLLDLGVGAVVQAALYKPLANNDKDSINSIYWSAKKFFNIIAGILIIYVCGLCVYYGIFKSNTYGWVYTCTLIGAIAISYFAQYYFGICNMLLLNADQKVYIVTIVNLFGLFANAIATIILLHLNMSIQVVKLTSSLIYLLRPLILEFYVRRNYKIKRTKVIEKDAIPQKWSGLAQHIASVVTNSVDNVVLTIFSTFSMVSIYAVYVLPLNSIKNLIDVTSTGYKSFFGMLIAKNNKKILNNEFNKYEVMMHYVILIIFITIFRTLIPFVMVYTSGVNDANYNNLSFCVSITLAYMMYSLRLPYTNVIAAAGKFKETQIYCLIECLLNIILSVVLVNICGLTGVAIGTVISSGYRLLSAVWYLNKDILYRTLQKFASQVLTDVIAASISIFITAFIKFEIKDFIMWFVYAAIIFSISVAVCTVVFFVCKKEYFEPAVIIKKMLGRES